MVCHSLLFNKYQLHSQGKKEGPTGSRAGVRRHLRGHGDSDNSPATIISNFGHCYNHTARAKTDTASHLSQDRENPNYANKGCHSLGGKTNDL